MESNGLKQQTYMYDSCTLSLIYSAFEHTGDKETNETNVTS
jgi:hypothetical protein